MLLNTMIGCKMEEIKYSNCSSILSRFFLVDYFDKNSFNNHNVSFMSNKEKAKLVIRYSQAIIFHIVINALKIVLIALYHMQI
jgi:hypothetical protein